MNPCGCGDNSQNQASSDASFQPGHRPASVQPLQETAECTDIVNETVCIQADVTITPNVEVGETESFCIGSPVIGACLGTPSPTGDCRFIVSQTICVEIPLTFMADAVVVPHGIICGLPGIGPCASESCTHSIGFYRNNPDVTNQLIIANGGSILLGTGAPGSASFLVTTANAAAVLSFNTPSPPAPASPPFGPQYRQLYAQLLAANLNVIKGSDCPFAITAINNANQFLGTSQSGVGKAGAPAVSSPLENYNTGQVPTCPPLCGDG